MATRQGHKSTGLETYCASWSGAVRCYAYYDEKTEIDMVRVELTQWHSIGQWPARILYEGPIGEYAPMLEVHSA